MCRMAGGRAALRRVLSVTDQAVELTAAGGPPTWYRRSMHAVAPPPPPPPRGPRSVSYSPDIEIAQPIRKITSHTNASVIMAGYTSRASGAVAFCTSGSKSGQWSERGRYRNRTRNSRRRCLPDSSYGSARRYCVAAVRSTWAVVPEPDPRNDDPPIRDPPMFLTGCYFVGPGASRARARGRRRSLSMAQTCSGWMGHSWQRSYAPALPATPKPWRRYGTRQCPGHLEEQDG